MGLWTFVTQDAPRAAIVAASLAAAAALIAATIAGTVANLVARRSVYINAVTAERSKWIEALRTTVSKLSGAADRVNTRRKESGYSDSKDWATDTDELHTLLSNLTLRLNPLEIEAQNLLRAAKKLSAAARLHSPAAVILADEIMIRHAQWVLKAEWDRVKEEASGLFGRIACKVRDGRRRRAYAVFLSKDGSLDRLDAIGAGKQDIELTLLRSEMDSPNVPRLKNSTTAT